MKLIYFDIPGKAEAIRLCAAVGGVQLDDVRISREKFHEMRDSGELPFGQVPALDVGDGRILAQSSAILRYVATLGGLHPTDPLEAAHVDAVAAAEEDFFAGISVSRYGARFGFEMSDEYRAQVAAAPHPHLEARLISTGQSLFWIHLNNAALAGPSDHAFCRHSRTSAKRYCSLRTASAPCPVVGVLSSLCGWSGS